MNKSRILVIDDSSTNIMLLKNIFEVEGFVVFTAESGKQALKIFEAKKPDIVLLDIMMPGMDGYEVLNEIRKTKTDVPVLMVTAKKEVADINKSFELGATDFIKKPFDVQVLVEKVKNLLHSANVKGKSEFNTFIQTEIITNLDSILEKIQNKINNFDKEEQKALSDIAVRTKEIKDYTDKINS
ncbi:MAG: hypothetical protein C0594_11835 [Marinilabiliales bacterium]|nr:MAG: hypothetical protein C0594_11835 [Marinilabiliales bacterium]